MRVALGRRDLQPVRTVRSEVEQRLAGQLLQLVAEQARDDVGRAAGRTGGVAEALDGADMFLGVSAGIVPEEIIATMAPGGIVFALSNPDPEIHPDVARKYAAIVATGRSDFPNQINNVLAFPGIFRGALASGAREISEPMKLAAARAIADLYDLCPGQPEDGKGAHPWDGCPDAADPARRVVPWGPSPKQAVKVTRGEIKISEEILFRSGSATIEPASQELLRSIAQILKDVPEIEMVEIAGHADDSGSDAKNKKLTEQRAASVMRDLVSKQIDKGRLRASGYSAYCPLVAGKDDAARARNRRVEFRILRRDGKNLEPHWAGCAEAEKKGLKNAKKVLADYRAEIKKLQ